MGTEHVLETRIQLRYDTLENWLSKNPILMVGEMAVAKVTYGTTIASSDSVPLNTPPAIGLKVGDGRSRFDELPWVQGVAADVYNWAKSASKPLYYANEIQGLQEYIELYGGGSGGGSGGGDVTVTARIYQLVAGTGDNANKYYLQYRTADESQWTIDNSCYIDLSQLAKISNWIGEDVDDYFSLGSRIYSQINTELHKLNVEDSYETGKAVVAINQTNGKISIEKRVLNLNELTGILSPANGGTGLSTIVEDAILVGTGANTFTTRLIENEVNNSINLVTSRAIKTYVDNKTAGITGAMHYIGEATVEINPAVNPRVNPNINGYDFSKVQNGDVITSGYKEYVWAGSWHLLGDESSYAIKGSIVNADISPEANISQSKIAGLTEELTNKVTKVDGKDLSTNDYTTAEKNKLEGIESGAQVNAIEHIFVNDTERPIITVNGLAKSITLSIDVFDEEHATKLDGIQAGAQVNTIEHIFVNNEERPISTINNAPKSVNIVFTPFTDVEKNKLANIEAEAQVNTLEKIIVNGVEYTPGANKAVSLSLSTIDGAKVPNADSTDYESIALVENTHFLEFARVAKTGNIKDLVQTNGEYVTLYCGTSTDVI